MQAFIMPVIVNYDMQPLNSKVNVNQENCTVCPTYNI